MSLEKNGSIFFSINDSLSIHLSKLSMSKRENYSKNLFLANFFINVLATVKWIWFFQRAHC